MRVELLAITPESEALIEECARTCYQSNDKFKGDGKMIKSLISSGHDSVLEHAYATFRINGVSRAMTHQLVRHRLCAFSQQSQRYVKEDQFEYVIPTAIENMKHLEDDESVNGADDFKNDMETIQGMYNKWKSRGVRNEDARFALPNSCVSEIVISANFREWRHIFKVRCDSHAQWEIRKAMTICLMYLNKEAPNVFFDYAEQYLEAV